MTHYHLGLNLGADRAAALVRDGEIVVAIHQERLDRHKYSLGFLHQAGGDPAQIQPPYEAIRYCLDHCGLRLADLATITGNMPGVDYAAAILRRTLPPEAANKVLDVPSHHLAHAYSAYWPSGFDEALVLVADGSGTSTADRRTESYTLYRAQGAQLTPIHAETVTAHLAGLSTLGFVYEYITRKAGFISPAGQGVYFPEAGKLMGLAPYGGEQPHWQRWIRPQEGGYHLAVAAYDIFLEVAALEKRYDDGQGAPYLRPYLVDLAWKVQRELEEALLHIVGLAVKETGLRTLCLAGGVALNSVANYRLYRQLDLEDVFTFPAAGDGGIAAGCALWAYATKEKGGRRTRMRTATLGHSYGDDAMRHALDHFADRLVVEELTGDAPVHRSAAALAKGHVIARFEAGSEFGPRALGHRSILADPTFAQMKDILNARVKFREAFRPFAPVIPEEDIATVFEQSVPSPFMLMVATIRPEYREQIPSVTHYDGTGRVQTVTAQDNPFMHRLCGTLAAVRGGPPVVLNTSFNVAGQPIVETPAEAIETFLRADIDYLVIGNYWVTKRDVPVLDYADHLAHVGDSALPHGLPPGQPDVLALMSQLDRALFGGETENTPWSTEELRALSAEGARHKETSALFPDTPFGPIRTQLSQDVVLLLDPVGQSELIDLTGAVPPTRYTWDETRWLLCAAQSPHHLELLRREGRMTTLEANQRIVWASGELRARRLMPAVDAGSLTHGADSPIPAGAAQTLVPFADAAFSARARLAALREVLGHAGYTEHAICQMLKIESLQRIAPTHVHYYDRFVLSNDAFGDLVRLFLLRVALPPARMREIIGEDLTAALLDLGILIQRGEAFASRVDLYCADGLLIATDHRYMLLDEDRLDEDPVMYLGMDSLGLVHTAPRRAVESALDLCTGSGVQTLVASRYAGHVTGVDLNPRALRFARFNAQLNGIDNVDFALGDLYQAVEGKIFDCILANPPFVPSPERALGFRDGGARGEDLLARIVSSAPDHLSAAGTLYIVTDLVDMATYEDKLAGWWQGGPADVLVLHTADRDDMLFSVPHAHAPFGQSFEEYNAELTQWVDNFHRAGLSAVNFGYILLRRSAGDVAGTYYARALHNPATPIHDQVEQHFAQRALLRQAGTVPLFVGLAPGLRVREESDVRSGGARCVELSVPGNPYFTTYRIDARLLDRLRTLSDGTVAWDTCRDGADAGWMEDMVLKGICRLTTKRPADHPGRSRVVDRSTVYTIEELATKTTPTCLSSYLRR
ncbi:MAG: methyltransferase [Gammaproteobacteria bacterium]|nr:methyltransferase [Gammaproteobacteria bacterium]